MLEQRDEGRHSNRFFKNLLQMAAIAAVSFIFFFFVVPNQPVKGGAVVVCAIGGLMATRACWNLRHYTWFWFTLGAIFVIQGAMIIVLPWSNIRFPGIILLPIGLADYALVYGIIKLVERFQMQKA